MMTPPFHSPSGHLDSDTIAAFAERRLAPPERVTAEAHLADCAECRADLVDVTGIFAEARRSRRRRVAVPVLAAAALATILLVPRTPEPIDESSVLRPAETTEPERLNTLVAILPAPGESASRAGLRFVWEPDGPDAIYEISVTDSSGTSLWRARTPDTSITLPDSVSLQPGGTYHWWVDVLLGDGRLASTGLREFTVRQ